jgi:predicted ATPase
VPHSPRVWLSDLGAWDSHLEPGSRESAHYITVHGASGSGKTSLVRQLQDYMLSNRAVIAMGKFEQYRQGAPFSALVEVIRSLNFAIFGDECDNGEDNG